MPGVRSRIWPTCLVILATLSAQARAQVGTWTISREPVVSIGMLSDDSLYELNRAESAIRMSNGDILVANRGSFQLRWYDARGRFVRSFGRRGQGPGEFRSLYVFNGAGDTVLVHDNTNRRVSRVSPDGKYLGIDSSGTPTGETWLYDRSVVSRLPRTADRVVLRSALLRIPHGDAAVRGVMIDESGNLLVRGPTDSAVYDVYDPSARRRGRLELPPRFELFQVFDTLVLGRYRDADGVEAIQVRKLIKQKSAANAAATSSRPVYDEANEQRVHSEVLGTARMTLRNLLTAQEMHHAQNKRYAASLKDLGGVALPQGLRLTLIAPTGSAYWIVAEVPESRVVCIVGVGSVVPFGYADGCG